MDFESAARAAFADEFGVQPNGCLFHLIQAWIRRAAKEGLNTKAERKKLLEMIFFLTCLVFIKPDTISSAFEQIKKEYIGLSKKHQNFFLYLEKNCLITTVSKKKGFRIEDWSFFEKLNQIEGMKLTNNASEAHFKLLSILMKDVFCIYNKICFIYKNLDFEAEFAEIL